MARTILTDAQRLRMALAFLRKYAMLISDGADTNEIWDFLERIDFEDAQRKAVRRG